MFKRNNKAEYIFLKPPINKPFKKFNQQEAKQYFDWYINKIPDRVEYLEKYSSVRLDYSMRSLIMIWRWFTKNAETESESEDVIKKMEVYLKGLPIEIVKKTLKDNSKKFTAKSEYILHDIAMYFGEVGVRNYKSLYWGYHTDIKRDSFANKPLLMGFEDRDFNPPFKAHFDPEFIVEGAASQILTGDSKKTDLLNSYKTWERMIFDS